MEAGISRCWGERANAARQAFRAGWQAISGEIWGLAGHHAPGCGSSAPQRSGSAFAKRLLNLKAWVQCRLKTGNAQQGTVAVARVETAGSTPATGGVWRRCRKPQLAGERQGAANTMPSMQLLPTSRLRAGPTAHAASACSAARSNGRSAGCSRPSHSHRPPTPPRAGVFSLKRCPATRPPDQRARASQRLAQWDPVPAARPSASALAGGPHGGAIARPLKPTRQRCWIAGRRRAPGRATPCRGLTPPPAARVLCRPRLTSASHGAHPLVRSGPAGAWAVVWWPAALSPGLGGCARSIGCAVGHRGLITPNWRPGVSAPGWRRMGEAPRRGQGQRAWRPLA